MDKSNKPLSRVREAEIGFQIQQNAWLERKNFIFQSPNRAYFGLQNPTGRDSGGMQHSRARIYSSPMGRFMQTDPIGYSGGNESIRLCAERSGKFYRSVRAAVRQFRAHSHATAAKPPISISSNPQPIKVIRFSMKAWTGSP